MSQPSLRRRLEAGETLLTAWSTTPDPLIAEFMARTDFDAVTLDMQHGAHSTDSVMRCIAGISLAGKATVVRVPVGRFEAASLALDQGASAVIAPMVNSADDARAFAAAMKFPPLGERSWGPTRVMALLGRPPIQTYLETANTDTLAVAMVETRAAYDALDDILAVEGIDGIFVGPSDFSIALSRGARVNSVDPEMLEVARDVAARTERAGKIPCTLAVTPEAAVTAQAHGFRFIAIGSDLNYLAAGANEAVRIARS